VQTLAEGIAAELKRLGADVLAAAPGPVKSRLEEAGMKIDNVLRLKEVSVRTWKALGKQGAVFPGGLTKMLITGLRTVPRWGKIKIMEKVMRGMTTGQSDA
jgi:short-subunit dehydrogenase